MALKRITVLISGRGSNLVALVRATHAGAIAGTVSHVISNRPQATGLAFAQGHAIETTVVDHAGFAQRAEFDAALSAAVAQGEPDVVVLAGFMRVLADGFVTQYAGRLINIHPSLLPLYPGLHTHRRALADGVRVHGCTVHFVTRDVDVGPIIAQGVVPVLQDDDETRLAARVLAVEHRILPAALAWYCDGRLTIVGHRVQVRGARIEDSSLLVPAAWTAPPDLSIS